MTKPSKSKASKTSTESQPEQPTETLKLKKEAAEPGAVATRDVGEGKGDSATASGGVISPVDSTLVGKAGTGRPAAEAKQDTANPVTDQPGVAEQSSESADMTKDTPKDNATTEIKGGVPPVDARKPAQAAVAASEKAPVSEVAPAGVTEPAPAPQQQVTVRKTGFWPVAFGGVVAAGLGAAATIWALPHLPAGWLPEQEAGIDAEVIREEAVTAATAAAEDAVANAPVAEAALPDDIQAMLEEHTQRIAALEEAGAASPESPDAATEGSEDAGAEPSDAGNASLVPSDDPEAPAIDLTGLQKQLEEQAAKIAQLEARPSIDPEAAERVQALADEAQSLQEQIGGMASDVESRIAAVQEEAAKLQEEAAESTRRAQAVAAVASLQAALDKGVTAQEAQQAFTDAGMDAPEALQKDIPSLDDLQAGFGDASRAVLRVSTSSDAEGGGGNALTNFLKAQTGARSVAPREGDDADAVLSRANASVEAGDIAAALDEMQALPENARQVPAMAEWLAGAQAYNDAQAALSDLTTSTN
ncbi:hypothetical protein Q0601_23345 [Paracoccus onubensis]|uniref:COG4223 family protein n=1 Tax=Paracoccus onubensis TaxID=1675788 RepID=UPI0027312ABA|nr:hypothetical protein [Paracoccus onubensis]MDP0930120.1 hypothetical protein [Paracoccus onubensis]